MVTLVNPVHFSNAELPIDVTLDGMVTLVNPVQPENAEEPIEVILLPNVYCFTCIPNIPAKELEVVYDFETISSLFSATSMRLLQSWNAELLIDVTLDGMVTLVNPVQPENV